VCVVGRNKGTKEMSGVPLIGQDLGLPGFYILIGEAARICQQKVARNATIAQKLNFSEDICWAESMLIKAGMY